MITEIQNKFIWMAFAEKRNYDDISKELKIGRKELTKWTSDLKEYWKPITEIYALYKKKNINSDFKLFYDFYLKLEQIKSCEYCKITEIELSIIKPYTKRLRGKKLELERKIPDSNYNDLANLTLACYWCNNAKTDTFSHEEFIIIGKSISEIWKKRLKNDKR
jgi:5-methylcytosine-specific restriction endonuclease McrA